MTKMRTRKPKKARQRPHAKSIAGFKIKQKYSVGAVSPDHGVLKQGELQQLRASKSLSYDKYEPGSAPIPKVAGQVEWKSRQCIRRHLRSQT